MEENKKFIEQIKEQIKRLKIEIIEKQDKLDELLKKMNNETEEEEDM